jgi:hypothetical protein
MLLLSLLACGDGVLRLSDANNHSVTLNYDVSTFPIDTDSGSVQLIWDSVTSDLRCRDVAMVAPMLELISSPLSAEELLSAIETQSMHSQDLVGYLTLDLAAGQPAYLEELAISGTAIELPWVRKTSSVFRLLASSEGVVAGLSG